MFKRFYIVLFSICLVGTNLHAQHTNMEVEHFVEHSNSAVSEDDILGSDGTYTEDSTKISLLNEFKVLSLRTFKKKRRQRYYDWLVKTVKKTYPFAKLAAERMDEYGAAVDTMKKPQLKDLVRSYEDEIKVKHGVTLKKLSIRQGFILLRLLDRETQHTPYAIVKKLKGSFNAFLYQLLAGFFDYDLKQGFDPQNREEDLWIDEICIMIDRGQL